ncbi:hypothetical protein PENARI_c019G11500 [Penicillium arizonense]|uniref:Uncharacterized protein n=1 Tax=Penicillium arizonense TaxID=1835702 RepID=A0A1F5L9K6_PENAI|nr:hypothetical protein PENARI_c019G11500 [Penicillium arizonense]OGE49894.1 hypothetical protein PENARI_c019G11500 [Penicillium arizonense]
MYSAAVEVGPPTPALDPGYTLPPWVPDWSTAQSACLLLHDALGPQRATHATAHSKALPQFIDTGSPTLLLHAHETIYWYYTPLSCDPVRRLGASAFAQNSKAAATSSAPDRASRTSNSPSSRDLSNIPMQELNVSRVMVINHIDTRRSGGMHTVAQLAARQLWGAALCTHSGICQWATMNMAKLLIVLLLFASTAYAAPNHFRLWFPQYRDPFERYMKNCMTTYDAYQKNLSCHPVNYGGCQSGRMVHCLLSQATESLKANMASAGVILGLLPTTLSLVGSTTVETGLLALRRPFLSLLLACGTPAVSPVRSFEYRDPIDLLRRTPTTIDIPKFNPMSATVIVIFQYIFALAAVANLAHVSWEFGAPLPLPKLKVESKRTRLGKENQNGVETECTTLNHDTSYPK